MKFVEMCIDHGYAARHFGASHIVPERGWRQPSASRSAPSSRIDMPERSRRGLRVG